MLEVKDVRLTYPGFSLEASFSIEQGERVALIGPSGAGKSTLLAGIAGFLRPKSGAILLDGTDITDRHPGQRSMATVFQDENLFPHMSAAQNIGLALSPSLKLSKDDHSRVSAALDRVGLLDFSERRPGELSGGQQARVTLARVILQDAKFVLLDEPFAALGPALRLNMLNLVRELCEEKSAGLLMVTHDPKDATALCPQTIVVAGSHTTGPMSTEQVLNDPPPELAHYLGN